MKFREQFLEPRRLGPPWRRRTEHVPYQGDLQIHRNGFLRTVRPDADGSVDLDLEPGDVLTAGDQVIVINGTVLDSYLTARGRSEDAGA